MKQQTETTETETTDLIEVRKLIDELSDKAYDHGYRSGSETGYKEGYRDATVAANVLCDCVECAEDDQIPTPAMDKCEGKEVECNCAEEQCCEEESAAEYNKRAFETKVNQVLEAVRTKLMDEADEVNIERTITGEFIVQTRQNL